jgi:tRNA(Ile)-lysidine synthase
MTPARFNSHLAQTLSQMFAGKPPLAIGVAVSGGGDSIALLRGLVAWARARRGVIFAASVDHGLRPEAAAEAAFVAELCAGLGVAHNILKWEQGPSGGNLQEAARHARYELLTAWANEHEITDVALGHTRDDQAETVLMRLARGSGVDGLAGMASKRMRNGVTWLRPLLSLDRADLRSCLEAMDQPWVEDPSNEDLRFDRIKARKILDLTGPLGLDVATLARTASHMADAREALETATLSLARQTLEDRSGDLVLDRIAFLQAPFELQTRLLAHAIGWVGSTPYRPRFRALSAVLDHLIEGRTQTLQGCLLSATKAEFRVTREYNAVADTCVPVETGLWDTRWRIEGPDAAALPEGGEIRPLGLNGLQQLAAEMRGDLPRSSRVALPAVWCGEQLVAAPLPDLAEGEWHLIRTSGEKHMLSLIMSH